MIQFFYGIGIGFIKSLLPIAALVSKKIKFFLRGRDSENTLFANYQRPEGLLYWFHCASLGEYEQAKPLIAYYKERGNIFITFFSPSGYDKIKLLSTPNFYVGYLPLESRNKTQEMIATIKPTHIFWIKYELWLISLKAIFDANIPVSLVSAVFRVNHFTLNWWAVAWRDLLPKFQHIFVQDQASVNFLESLKMNSILTGDTRFDNMDSLKKEPMENEKLTHWIGHSRLLVVGSSWQAEEAIIAQVVHQLPNWKIIIAPHDISARHLSKIKDMLISKNISFGFWSNGFVEENSILVIDNIGILSKLYAFADLALVGGGFRNALHNILEPIAWGKCVMTGPNIEKNWEAHKARAVGILHLIKNDEDVRSVINKYENNNLPNATFIQQFVSNNEGAIKIISRYI